MNTRDHSDDAKYLPQLLRMAAVLKELEARLESSERAASEPIAIIGMGCRIPGGGDTPDAFWQMLAAGLDAVSEMPAERLRLDPSSAGLDPNAVPWGAFLRDVDRFDPQFFGISPREAAQMDPQQRLLLEVAWEALEHAGIVPERLMGTQTGVFVGMTTNDYLMLSNAAGPETQDAYAGTGNGHCFPAGRLSYVLGLQGPSLVVDTACSSSLVAIHLACQSLRSRESSFCLAGGVNLVLSLAMTRLIAQLQALSPDGRCKAFDAQANGFVRGEGCGLVALKRLSDALSDNDRILALIRGSAVNQDGRSIGLTAPNLVAQQKMLHQALENARSVPSDISYIETHGTGTSLGDPIEIAALIDVLGKPRDDGSVCALGALKTNIGHLEAAAGVAGLIKLVLALEHDMIPANLHFKKLNPRITLDGTPFVLPTQALTWPQGAKPRVAGVSSFGMSGTNAHLVVEQAPSRPPSGPALEPQGVGLLPLSARSREALVDLAQSYERFLEQEPDDRAEALRDILYTASLRRSHHEHRLAVTGRSRQELAAALRSFSQAATRTSAAKEEFKAQPRVVFVFSGQGSQRPGMGRELWATQPVFRETLEKCAALIRRYGAFSLLDELNAPEDRSRLDETSVAQPAIFSIQVAMSALFSTFGVKPDAVIGHSVGEVAAAHVAGVLSLEDAIRLVLHRGQLMEREDALGGMVTVTLSAEEAARELVGYGDQLSIAAINDPSSVVISGEERALGTLVARLQQCGVSCRTLKVKYAFHSPRMDSSVKELRSAIGSLQLCPTTIPVYSTVLGKRIEHAELDASYWAKNIRDPVLFARAVELAVADRHRVFLEVGPRSVLANNIQQCLLDWRLDGYALPTLRRGQEELRSVFSALGGLYTAGCALDFQRFFPEGGRVVTLPTYPWQRQRYWLPLTVAPDQGQASAELRDEKLQQVEASEPPQHRARSWLATLLELPLEARRARIEAEIRADVASVLLLPTPDAIPSGKSFSELGMDSLMAVQLRYELAARTGQDLPSSLAFNYPTINDLTHYLYGRLLALDDAGAPAEDRTVAASQSE